MAPIALLCGAGGTALGGCGSGSFKNNPRPAVSIQLTGVITDQGVTVSPNKLGAGPIVLIISNQAHQAHTVTLKGNGDKTSIGPINPLDTGKIQQSLKPGRYTVVAGSSKAVMREPAAATIAVTRPRPSSSNTVDLP